MTSVTCYGCAQPSIDKTSSPLPAVIDGIMNAMAFSKQEEVKAWEQEFIPCEHTLCLNQPAVEDPQNHGTSSKMMRYEL